MFDCIQITPTISGHSDQAVQAFQLELGHSDHDSDRGTTTTDTERLSNINSEGEKHIRLNVKIIVKKTMVISRKIQQLKIDITLVGHKLKQVEKFVYLVFWTCYN